MTTPTEDRDWKEKVISLAHEMGGKEPTVSEEEFISAIDHLITTAEARGQGRAINALRMVAATDKSGDAPDTLEEMIAIARLTRLS